MSAVKVGLSAVLEVLQNKTTLDTPTYHVHRWMGAQHREPLEITLITITPN